MDNLEKKQNSALQIKRLLQLFWATEFSLVIIIIQRIYLSSWTQALAVAGFAILLTSVYIMAHRGKEKLGGYILLLLLTFMLLGFIWKFQGLRDEVLLVFPAIIMFSLLLGSRSFAFYIYLFVCLNVFFIGFLNQYNYIYHGHTDSDLSAAILIIIILSVISYAVLLIAKDIKKTNDALQQSKVELEMRVTQRTAELQQSLDNLTQTQEQLVEAEKMASLGRLVAGVAHEINTPLGIAITASSHLENEADDFNQQFKNDAISKKQLEKHIDIVAKTSQLISSNLVRSAKLIQSFKDVAVDQSNDLQRKFNLKNYLNEILTSLTPEIKGTHHKVELFCDDNIELFTNPGSLAQIITNLFINAIQHGFEHSNEGLISIIVNQDNNNISIIFIDSGCGIPPENLGMIFEPFFTTKRGSGGSGLGMHITYNLVTQSLKGIITCTSTLNKGTQFELIFPSNVAE